VKYKDREGHCNVPQSHVEDGENLGTWLKTQRKWKEKLNTDQIKRLDEIGVMWDLLSQQWEKNLSLLVKYKDREGHCNVLQRHKEEGENLGAWLNTQRLAKRKGNLNIYQLKKLDEIGVVWNVRN